MHRNHAHTIPAADLHRQHDQAHAEALALRAQAIDDFWRGTDAWVGSAVQRIERSSQRWAQAWRRHGRQAAGVPASATCNGAPRG